MCLIAISTELSETTGLIPVSDDDDRKHSNQTPHKQDAENARETTFLTSYLGEQRVTWNE